jgi:hypothetical protein
MTVFDKIPAAPPPPSPLNSRRWLLVLPVLAALAWAGLTATQHPRAWHQGLQKLRGEAPADAGPNRSMDTSLTIRRLILMHQVTKLSAGQSASLIGLIASPRDDQSQSEALDVLGLAQRADALSADQAQKALAATLRVLGHTPGPMVRLESARLLGHLGNPSSIPALLTLQRDSDPKVQSAAGDALAQVRK